MFGFIKSVRLKLWIRSELRKQKRCPTDEMIDNYLLNRLNEKDERKIDLHLFDCQRCFLKARGRQDLIDGVKIVYKHKSDYLEKAMKRTARRIL